MKNEKIKLVVGFITYGRLTSDYLPYFLESLHRQTFKEFAAVAFDNTEELENSNVSYIEERFPIIEIMRADKNIGFAAAYNRLLEKAKELGAEYFLAANPDTFFDSRALANLIKVMDADPELGSASPKIYKWDFKENVRTKIIDTCGIKLVTGLKFVDMGQGQVDYGQYNNADILGPSGAAAIYRMSAMEKIIKGGQYFDELMFMYKEDCDLAYRLHLAGFKSKCAYKAIVHHDRTTGMAGGGFFGFLAGRANKSQQVKKWSFLNQQIIFKKYWHRQNLIGKIVISFRKLELIIFALFFEPYLLEQFNNFRKLKGKINIY